MVKAVRSRTRDDPEVRREQILEAAIRILGERGYHGFTVQELAQRCGLTNGGLLYHFGSKEQLLLAVLQERDRRDTEVVISVAGPAAREAKRSDSSLGAVLDLLRAIAGRVCAQPELARLDTVLQAEALDPAHPAHGYFRAREARLVEVFATIVAPHAQDPGSKARQLLALMAGLRLQWLRGDQSFDLLAEWDSAVALLLPAIRRRGKPS